MSAAENEAIARKLVDLFNAHNSDPTWAAQSAALATDDFVGTDMPSGTVMRGPEGAKQFGQTWAQAFGDARIDAPGISATDDGAVVEFIGRGTHTGPLTGPAGTIPATGKSVEVRFCHVYKMRDGKVAEERLYYDTLGLLSQLGVIPAPATANVQAKQP